MSAYGVLDKLLHRLALQATILAELGFDLDQLTSDADAAAAAAGRHVFITGLARAGTTALLRRLYASGDFRSLTYRDMPFVLAPNLWHGLAKLSRKRIAPTERAHGDRIVVDADSPEGFDEVFWRVFAGTDYIGRRHLHPHDPDDETLDKFARYVGAVLAAGQGGPARYLSKNNNNILRLPAIRRAFPNALILILFRDPVAQAGSLLNQHRRFLKIQDHDRFSLHYMTWLAHHEFGHGHRPFRFDGARWKRDAAHRDESLDYWLALWCQTYRWLETAAPNDAIFVCYEDLCNDPAVWPKLAGLAEVDARAGQEAAFRPSDRAVDEKMSGALAEEAAGLYARLVARARKALG